MKKSSFILLIISLVFTSLCICGLIYLLATSLYSTVALYLAKPENEQGKAWAHLFMVSFAAISIVLIIVTVIILMCLLLEILTFKKEIPSPIYFVFGTLTLNPLLITLAILFVVQRRKQDKIANLQLA